eukprot:COSAG01_NODE_12156_length_1789_cov_6.102246_2_plen_192_part_01
MPAPTSVHRAASTVRVIAGISPFRPRQHCRAGARRDVEQWSREVQAHAHRLLPCELLAWLPSQLPAGCRSRCRCRCLGRHLEDVQVEEDIRVRRRDVPDRSRLTPDEAPPSWSETARALSASSELMSRRTPRRVGRDVGDVVDDVGVGRTSACSLRAPPKLGREPNSSLSQTLAVCCGLASCPAVCSRLATC